MRTSRKTLPMVIVALVVGVALGLGANQALAQVIDLNTLHGFCGTSAATSTCTDNGAITPTSNNPLSPFGFTRSPDTNSGLTNPTITLEFLIPNNETVTFGAFASTGTGAPTSVTPSVKAGTWSSGDLLAFLGYTQTGGPNNPISAYLPQTQGIGGDPGATGYHVFEAKFGTVNFGSPDPTWTDSTTLPLGTVILGLVQWTGVGTAPSGQGSTCTTAATCVQDATANSAAIIETGGGGGSSGSIPEPASLLLLGGGLVGLAAIRRWKA